MLDFKAVRDKKITLAELVAGLTCDDLRALTNEMVDAMQGLIAGCVDADVTFVPVDPAAHDRFAAKEEEVKLAWNLGHVIVHTTASAEESAALAAELARGVELSRSFPLRNSLANGDDDCAVSPAAGGESPHEADEPGDVAR